MTSQSVEALLADVRARGILLSAAEGQLRVEAPSGAIDDALVDALRAHKPALLRRLSALLVDDAGADLDQGGMPVLQVDADGAYEPFPLTDIQQAYWVGRGGDIELGAAIHVYVELECEHLDIGRLGQAWDRLVQRHPMLRAVVSASTGQQRVLESVPVYEIPVDDLSRSDETAVAEHLFAIRERMSHQQLPLDHWPLFELRAVRLDDHSHRLFLDVDCTLIDSWGVQLLFRELATTYHAPDADLGELGMTFRDYVQSVAVLPTTESYRQSARYWDARLDTLPPPPQLPMSGRKVQGRPVFRRREQRVPAEQLASFSARAVARGVTPTSALISAYAEVVGRWATEPRFTLNIPLFNRLPIHPDVNGVLGTFSSFTLLEVDRRDGATFAERAQAIHRQLMADLQHRHAAGVRLIRELNRARGRIDGAAMPVVFTSFAGGVDGAESFWTDDLGAAFGTVVHAVTQTPQVWIDQQVLHQHGGLYLNWDAADALFLPGLLDAMFTAQSDLLADLAAGDAAWDVAWHVAGDPVPVAAPVASIPETAEAPLVHDPIVAQVVAGPDRPAVIAPDGTLTYGALMDRALRLAGALDALLVAARSPVAVALPAGLDQATAALAALLSGRPYMPMDLELPAARRQQIVETAASEVVLTVDGEGGTRTVAELLALDVAPSRPVDDVTGDDVAAIIHTSGTTGLPVGVALTHRGLRNALAATVAAFDLGGSDRTLALTPVFHDMSLFDLLGALSTGGAVVTPDPRRRRDPSHWLDLVHAHRVTVWNSVPALAGMLLDHLGSSERLNGSDLRVAFLGGDWIPLDMPDRLRGHLPGLRVVSVGGPTETTLWNIWYEVDKIDPAWASVPYGRPIPGADYHVLDEALEERPVWAAGELCCSGITLARGYVGLPELTAERFVTHPRTGERLYRTGDLGRRRPDGTIEILGRIDLQLSVNGRRIEPQEIEATLTGLDSVDAAIIVASDTTLVGFYTSDEGIEPSALKRLLAAELPPYLVPHRLERIRSIPLSPAGKPDRAGLAARAAELMARGTEPAEGALVPNGGMRAAVAGLLTEILQTPVTDPGQSFFDIGATSVHLVRLHAALRDRLGVDLAVTDLFQHPSLAALAAHLDGSAHLSATPEPMVASDEPVAIIGMSGRFPGAPDLATFWDNLREGRESIRWFSDEELLAAGIDAEVLARPDYVKAAAVLEDIAGFDAPLFGLTAREAELTDPQQRLFLECAWEALEAAGYPAGTPGLRVGVFAGKSISNYLFPVLDLADPINYFRVLFGNDKDYVATQTSYLLDLTGPSVAMQTACSTSLVTLDAALAALRAGSCDMALSGGASVKIPHVAGYDGSLEAGMFAPDGHVHPFDATAAGTVPGSGVGVMALKLLSRAVSDGDHIHAVVRGVGVTNDGAGKVGFTAPSVDGQRRAIQQAHAAADVRPQEIGFVEAHGTGTPLGDPIEIAALSQAFGDAHPSAGVVLGAVKSNIGHLDSAAGVAGLIKTALALEHEEIPPTLNHVTTNPRIDFAATPFRVTTQVQPWPRGERPRLAGVSSFGVGGTNAHAVLQEAPPRAAATPQDGPVLLPLSARDPAALADYAHRWSAALEDGAPLRDLAWTAQVGRRPMSERAAVVGAEAGDLRAALAALAAGEEHDLLVRGTAASSRLGGSTDGPPKVAMLFAGHGAQHTGMAETLFGTSPVFREHLLACEDILGSRIGGRLTELLYPGGPPGDLHDLTLAQTALFAVETGLARLWRDWGVEPVALIGHSLGELAALQVAGVLSLEDALGFVADRVELIEAHGLPGRTVVALCGADELEPLIAGYDGRVAAGSDNAPHSVVVSGHPDAMDDLTGQLEARGIAIRDLNVTRAAHSPLMDPVIDPLRAAAAGLTFHPMTIPVVSNRTARPLATGQVDADYLARHVREPVRLRQGFATLRELGCSAFVEVGPRPTLTWLGQECLTDETLTWAHSLRKGRDDRHELLLNLGRLHTRGLDVPWDRVAPGRRVPAPTYPFQRQRYWAPDTIQDRERRRGQATPLADGHPLLGQPVHAPGLPEGERRFASTLTTDQPAWVADHAAAGATFLPASAVLELMLAAGSAIGIDHPAVTDVVIQRPLVIPAGEEVLVHTIVHSVDSGTDLPGSTVVVNAAVAPAGAEAPTWAVFAEGMLGPAGPAPSTRRIDVPRGEPDLTGSDHYARAAAQGVTFGPTFQGLIEVFGEPHGGGIARVRSTGEEACYRLHPAVLDACLQAVVALEAKPTVGWVWLPASVGRCVTYAPLPAGDVLSLVSITDRSGSSVIADVTITDPDGRVLASVDGLRLVLTELEGLAETDPQTVSRLLHHIQWRPVPLTPADRPRPLVHVVPTDGDGDLATRIAGAVMGATDAIVKAAGAETPLVLITSGGQTLDEQARPDPVQAAIWGLAVVAGREYPQLDLTVVDRGSAADRSGEGVEDGIEKAVATAASTDEPFVVHRGQYAHVPRLVHGPGGQVDPVAQVRLDEHAAYLITGGVGQLGLETARLLAARGAHHLVLVSRHAADAADPRLTALADTVDVRLVDVDLRDERAVRTLIAAICVERPLRGVVHAAGLVDDALIADQTHEQVHEITAAKVGGAATLDQATRGLPLDHFVIFSSTAAHLGGPGQGAYAAANAAVEALAAARRADGFPATCIAWGPWASSASLVAARRLEHLTQMGQELLSVRLGVRALDALLAGEAAQPVVTAVRWQSAREDLDCPRTVELLGPRSSTPAPANRHKSILDGLSEPALARQVLEAAVRQHVASLCGLGGPGQVLATAGFADQGLDSLGAVELRNRLQRDLGERLPATLAFTYPSVQELATHLTERLVGAVAGAPDGSAQLSAADLADLLEAELGGGA